MAGDARSFNQLFALLSPASRVGQEVWDVLMLLPTNTATLLQFITLEEATYGNW